jgi:hypothetical protein
MEQEIIPFQVSKGMVITGSYRGEEDDTVYIWTRRFNSEEERKELYAAVYETDHWKNNIAPRVTELMDRSAMQVTRIVPTDKSVAQEQSAKSPIDTFTTRGSYLCASASGHTPVNPGRIYQRSPGTPKKPAGTGYGLPTILCRIRKTTAAPATRPGR